MCKESTNPDFASAESTSPSSTEDQILGKNTHKLCHSGIYGHKNETQILEIVAFIVQFYTYFNTYDMN